MHRLLCPPDCFEIEYSINPWMDVRNKVDKAEAFAQWNALVTQLQTLGDTLEFIAPVPGLPDMTFAGDAGLVFDRTFIASNFRAIERRGEAQHFIRWFREHDYNVVQFPADVYFEGLGDVVFSGTRAIVGHGLRSDPEAVCHLQNVLGQLEIVCEMFITDPRYFHLAMALSFLDDSTVLYHAPAFDKKSVERLRDSISRAVPVDAEDANHHFACNNLVIGNRILLDGCTPQLRARLSKIGYEPLIVPMSEFKKSGGSLRCLVLSFIESSPNPPDENSRN